MQVATSLLDVLGSDTARTIVSMSAGLLLGLVVMGLGQAFCALAEVVANTRDSEKSDAADQKSTGLLFRLLVVGGTLEVLGGLIAAVAVGWGVSLLTAPASH